MSGGTQYLPLKVNYAGVMPVIFATAILQLPTQLLGQMFPGSDWIFKMNEFLSPNDIGFLRPLRVHDLFLQFLLGCDDVPAFGGS